MILKRKDERYAFWKGFKFLVYALTSLFVIAAIACAITGDWKSVFDFGGNHQLVIVYQVTLVSSLLMTIALLSVGLIFCFVKIVTLVWTTSSKIAKLLRTDDRPLVFALRRKMYAYLTVFAIGAVLAILDFFLNSCELIFFLTVGFEQLSLHFLEFVRIGVANLDDYELRSKSYVAGGESECLQQVDSLNSL
jgi:hypothetical protein